MMKGQKGYVMAFKGLSGEGHIVRALSSFKRQVMRWHELHRQRQMLATLSDEALKDLGLTRADTLHEREEPFWHDSMKH